MATAASRCELFWEIVCAVILPPLGVFFRHGCCTFEFLLCVVLTILGYVPGIIYALYVILVVDRNAGNEESQYRELP